MPDARLERTRRKYLPGDLHKEHRAGRVADGIFIPDRCPCGTAITNGPLQGARERGAKMMLWNDQVWSTVTPVQPLAPCAFRLDNPWKGFSVTVTDGCMKVVQS